MQGPSRIAIAATLTAALAAAPGRADDSILAPPPPPATPDKDLGTALGEGFDAARRGVGWIGVQTEAGVERTKEGAQAAGAWTGKKAGATGDAWDATKQGAGNAWDATKEGASRAWDATRRVFQ